MNVSKFITFQYDSPNRLLISCWLTTAQMSDEEYRQVAMAYREACEIYRPFRSLIDGRRACYVIPPQTQLWLSDNIYPQCIKAGVHKLAFLVAKDFYTQISLELTVLESEEKIRTNLQKLQQFFFADFDKAKAWLLS
ncbi:MAG: hypothetical protein RMJ44_02530 [Cytophagales bacterium]|nr:hypothetical protein [Bernardetiaceae bacterium]MDW8209938.1 hypothetical protein [Cytophagales bacterium]